MQTIRKHLSYANVMATAAVFLATPIRRPEPSS